MSWRPWLEDRALRQMQGLPSEAFDMLVRTLARICDDPYDPVFSAPVPPVPGRRVADLGDFGFIEFIADEATGLESGRMTSGPGFAAYGAQFPKAAAKITGDEEELLVFYDYPAEHWVHLRTTNPPAFAAVRLSCGMQLHEP